MCSLVCVPLSFACSRHCALLLPFVEDEVRCDETTARDHQITWSHFHISAFVWSCSSRCKRSTGKPPPHSMFTPLSLINNLSIPCSSLFYLNKDTSLITSPQPPPRRTQQHYSGIFFDLDWMNNEVVQPQIAKWHWGYKVLFFYVCLNG